MTDATRPRLVAASAAVVAVALGVAVSFWLARREVNVLDLLETLLFDPRTLGAVAFTFITTAYAIEFAESIHLRLKARNQAAPAPEKHDDSRRKAWDQAQQRMTGTGSQQETAPAPVARSNEAGEFQVQDAGAASAPRGGSGSSAGASVGQGSSAAARQKQWIQQLQAETEALARRRREEEAAARARRASELLAELQRPVVRLDGASEGRPPPGMELLHHQLQAALQQAEQEREAQPAQTAEQAASERFAATLHQGGEGGWQQVEEARQLRAEQDREFTEALQADRQREEEQQRRAAEARRQQEEAAEQLRLQQEEAAQKAQRLAQLRQQLRESLPEEPGAGEEEVVAVRVRLPGGGAPCSRRFPGRASVEALYGWVQQLEGMELEPGCWRLVHSYPRSEVGRDGGLAVALGGVRQVALVVEEVEGRASA